MKIITYYEHEAILKSNVSMLNDLFQWQNCKVQLKSPKCHALSRLQKCAGQAKSMQMRMACYIKKLISLTSTHRLSSPLSSSSSSPSEGKSIAWCAGSSLSGGRLPGQIHFKGKTWGGRNVSRKYWIFGQKCVSQSKAWGLIIYLIK